MWWDQSGPRDPGEVTMTEEDLKEAMAGVLKTHRLVLARAVERLSRALILCEDAATFKDCMQAAHEGLTLLSDALKNYRPPSKKSNETSPSSHYTSANEVAEMSCLGKDVE